MHGSDVKAVIVGQRHKESEDQRDERQENETQKPRGYKKVKGARFTLCAL